MRNVITFFLFAATIVFAGDYTKVERDFGGQPTAKEFVREITIDSGQCQTFFPLGQSTAASGKWVVQVFNENADRVRWRIDAVELADSGKRPGFVALAITGCAPKDGGGDFILAGNSR